MIEKVTREQHRIIFLEVKGQDSFIIKFLPILKNKAFPKLSQSPS